MVLEATHITPSFSRYHNDDLVNNTPPPLPNPLITYTDKGPVPIVNHHPGVLNDVQIRTCDPIHDSTSETSNVIDVKYIDIIYGRSAPSVK